MKLHKSFVRQAARGNIDLLFIGDSITENFQTAGKPIWNSEFSQWRTANFGISGDTTQGVYRRISQGELDGIQPRVVVLLIGTNNISAGVQSPEEIAADIKMIVEVVRNKLPETKILLLGILPRDSQPDAPVRQTIKEINNRLGALDDGRYVYFLEIGDRFTDAQGRISPDVMPDFLHLSEKGYRIWANAMRPLLRRLMS
ncbi:MAG TPA: GDSL-type esterase/lipase family protein [Candidatus Obscuribacterales bacterium]